MTPTTLTRSAPSETTAEYFYDYAGQDPINGFDLQGTFAGPPCLGSFCKAWAKRMCRTYHQACHGGGSDPFSWLKKHVWDVFFTSADIKFCYEGGKLGLRLGSRSGPWGAFFGAVGGCLVNSITEFIYVHRFRHRLSHWHS